MPKPTLLTAPQVQERLQRLTGWKAEGTSLLRKQLKLTDFMAVIRTVNRIAELAEQQDHHPDLHMTGYRHLTIELATHSIGGLSDNDFILAAKIDTMLSTDGS